MRIAQQVHQSPHAIELELSGAIGNAGGPLVVDAPQQKFGGSRRTLSAGNGHRANHIVEMPNVSGWLSVVFRVNWTARKEKGPLGERDAPSGPVQGGKRIGGTANQRLYPIVIRWKAIVLVRTREVRLKRLRFLFICLLANDC
jgi:hypothetical protein